MNQSTINKNISRWRAKNVRAQGPRKTTRTQVSGYGLKMTQWGQPSDAERWADFDGLILTPGNVLLDRQESAMLIKDREYFIRDGSALYSIACLTPINLEPAQTEVGSN